MSTATILAPGAPNLQPTRRPAIPATFDLWAEVYDDQPNPFLSLEQRILASLLPADLTSLDVLDAGCGTGRLLSLLYHRTPRSIIGVDSSPAMLAHAAQHFAGDLRRGSCTALPVPDATIDCVLSSFVLSYLSELEVFADEIVRVTRPGALVLLSDLHPRTARTLRWRRSFPWSGMEIEITSYSWQLEELRDVFADRGFAVSACVEPPFAAPEQRIFRQAGRSAFLDAMNDAPAIYVLALRREPQKTQPPQLSLRGAHYALTPYDAVLGTLDAREGAVALLDSAAEPEAESPTLDLSGYLVLPGLVNAHDHLEFGLFPRIGHGPYENSAQWADDIHAHDAKLIALHRSVPRETSIQWGAIRNLLCGVTTVCHHNPLTPEMLDPAFPVTVLDRFYWAHSLAHDPDLAAKAHVANPDQPFLFHAAEGVDAQSAEEFGRLDSLGVLNPRSVLVHGLGLSLADAAQLNEYGAALIICPTSNQFLFDRTPSNKLLASIRNLALGSDSPLTATGDLLDELRFVRENLALPDDLLYRTITTTPAAILRLASGEGRIAPRNVADLIAVRDVGKSPAVTLSRLSASDVELVLRSGRVFLASDAIYARLPQHLRAGLQSLLLDGERRWLRAPLQHLFHQSRPLMKNGALTLAGKQVHPEQPL